MSSAEVPYHTHNPCCICALSLSSQTINTQPQQRCKAALRRVTDEFSFEQVMNTFRDVEFVGSMRIGILEEEEAATEEQKLLETWSIITRVADKIWQDYRAHDE